MLLQKWDKDACFVWSKVVICYNLVFTSCVDTYWPLSFWLLTVCWIFDHYILLVSLHMLSLCRLIWLDNCENPHLPTLHEPKLTFY